MLQIYKNYYYVLHLYPECPTLLQISVIGIFEILHNTFEGRPLPNLDYNFQ